MKVKKFQIETQTSGTPGPMPRDLKVLLSGKTIAEARNAGVIDELGDDDGAFIKASANPNSDAHYAIVQGFLVKVSAAVVEFVADEDNNIGHLKFMLETSSKEDGFSGNEYFRLAVPLILGETIKSLDKELVEA